MKKTCAFLIFFLGILSACSTAPKTTVIPRDNGTYDVISTSGDESKALDAAVDAGNRYCDTRGKDFVVPERNADLKKSLPPEAQQAAGIAGVVVGMAGGSAIRNQYEKNSLYSRDKNQLVMNFKCVAK